MSSGFLQSITPTLLNGLFGVVAGIAALVAMLAVKKLLPVTKAS